MKIRTYGEEPFSIAVVHAGPGCTGASAELAREISKRYGVIEPLQSAETIDDQVKELEEQLTSITKSPVILIGHDWGAWLSVLLAAKRPELVKKLILIGTPPLEEKYRIELECNREYHFTSEEMKHYKQLQHRLFDQEEPDKNKLLYQLAQLCVKADEYQPVSTEEALQDLVELNGELFYKMCTQIKELRNNGEMLENFQKVLCPICIMHGVYDTYPMVGVLEPLMQRQVAHRVSMIDDCGHTPWRERIAYKDFYRALYYEIETM